MTESGASGAELLVRSGAGAYPVHVRPGVLERLPELVLDAVAVRRFAVVSDDRVAPLYAEAVTDALRSAGCDAVLLTFPEGEASKTRKQWSILTDEMLDASLGRDSAVIGVGGGVTTDLAGFVAATYMRGVPVVQVPTSYLAMIDASVGGKTGVDTRHGKNLVGAFHPPAMVVVDPNVLSTLPVDERREGLVEAYKHGCILDRAYFDGLVADTEALMDADVEVATWAIARSVEMKADVVGTDERESGYRQVLNFGHTVGHAVEAASDFALGHGSAVAYGMVAEAAIGEALGVTAEGTVGLLREVFTRLLGAFPGPFDPSAASPFLASDKKSRGGRPRCVLLREIGEVDAGDRWSHEVTEKLVTEVMGRL